MPKSLADGARRLIVLPAPPANKDAITLDEVTAGLYASPFILDSDYALGPTGSQTVDEKAQSVKGNVQVPTTANLEGGFSAFLYFDPATKQLSDVDNELWSLVQDGWQELHLVERESAKASTEEFTEGDPYCYYRVVTDLPVRSTLEGYIKRRVNLFIQEFALNKTIAATV